MGAKRCDDDCLYELDAIAVGLLLFPARVCTTCGHELPGNADYFQPDKSRRTGLTSSCRRCRGVSQRGRYARQRAAS